MAECLVLLSKNITGPKDVSAWVLRTVSQDTQTFAYPERVSTEVRLTVNDLKHSLTSQYQQLAHFFLTHLEDLFRLEGDIRFRLTVPARPSEVKDLSPKALETTKTGAEMAIKRIIADMIKAGTKAITTGHWALDYVTHHDWRKESKNKTRDYQKYAIAAYLEETLVPTYRETLFEQSAAAALLRFELHDLLSKHAKKRAVIVPSTKKTQTVQRYDFPDGLPDPRNDVSYTEDLGDIMNELTSTGPQTKMKQTIKKATKALLKLPSALLTPRTKKINPEIATLVSNLERVHLIPLPFCFALFLIHSPGVFIERRTTGENGGRPLR